MRVRAGHLGLMVLALALLALGSWVGGVWGDRNAVERGGTNAAPAKHAKERTEKSPRTSVFPDVSASREPDGPRLVILSPALAVTARDLGLEKFVVGRHAYDVALDPTVPVCGDQSGIDYEALLKARPTRVLVEWGSRPLPARLVELAERNRWAVANMNLLALEDITAAARELERTLLRPLKQRGLVPEQAGERELAALGTAWNQRFETPPTGRVLLLGRDGPASAFGPGSFHYQILERMGARPAIRDGQPFITMDAEDVLRLAPDAIVIVEARPPSESPGARDVESLRRRLGKVGTLEIPAVRNGKLGLIDDPLCHMPSTAMVRFADELEGTLRALEEK